MTASVISTEYHRPQIEAFADTEADLVSALTLNYVHEAIGIAHAALDEGDIGEFGALHAKLCDQLPSLCVIGGCCGTDQRHVEQACLALRPGVASA